MKSPHKFFRGVPPERPTDSASTEPPIQVSEITGYGTALPHRPPVLPTPPPPQDGPDRCQSCRNRMPDDIGDAVVLEAPQAFIDKHLDDNTPILKIWHRACFEDAFHVKLPTWPEER